MMPSLLTPSRRSLRLLAGFVTIGLLAGGQLAAATPAFAAGATRIAVTSTADADGTSACTTTSTTLASPVTLRNALCVANNLGGSVDIDVPAGAYKLSDSLGALPVGTQDGADISLVGAGAASTIITGDGSNQVFVLDPTLVGGVSVSMDGLTITGGVDNVYGGGAIIGGSGSPTVSDTLRLTGVTVTSNRANTTSTATNNPGGAIQFIGGSLSIVDSTISNNSSGTSPGGGVAYQAMGAPGESLTISGTRFSGNSTRTAGNLPNGGGALSIDNAAASAAAVSITNSTFTANTAVGGAGEPARGGAIWLRGGSVTLESSTFTGNAITPTNTAAGAAIQQDGGTLTASYNRFAGNTGGAQLAVGAGSAATAAASNNWWGCATPGSGGCAPVVGTAASAYTPYLTLTATAGTTPIVPPSTQTVVTASLLKNSAGTSIAPSKLTALDGLPIVWGTPLPTGSTVSAATATLSGGSAQATVNAESTFGPGSLVVSLDQGSATAAFAIHTPATITSGATAKFVVGTSGSTTITTTGYPYPVITADALPSGVALVNSNNGTARLVATPSAGTGNSYPITLRAHNGVGSDATQPFVLTIAEAPSFTSAAATTFESGNAGSFTVRAGGFPVSSPITQTGTLPAGVTFADNGDGTATLSGTPSATAGGSYPLTFSASNGTSPDAAQSFVLTVNQGIVITSQPVDVTVAAGSAASFSASATGFPAPNVRWQRSLDSGLNYTDVVGATTASLSITATQGETGALYRAVFSSDGATAFSAAGGLTVYTPVTVAVAPPVLTVNGSRQSATITTTGSPTAALSVTGVPTWLTLTDYGTGIGTLDGTPPIGSGGEYILSVSATNGFGTPAVQAFTLTVNEPPRITSADTAAFAVGQFGRFDLQISHSYPAMAGTAVGGLLPVGITWISSGPSSFALEGTPAAGSEGVYSVTVAPFNGVGSGPAQTLTITVTAAPVITLQPVNQFVATGSTVSFTAAATGFPTPTVRWQVATRAGASFTDIPDETATTLNVQATRALDGYQYRAAFSGAGVTTMSGAATLTVGTVPAITSAPDVAFSQTGGAQSFTVTTAAIPDAVLTHTGTLPGWLTFTDNGDGTATLAGDPAVGSAGETTFDIDATNRFGTAATQRFTLTVTSVPAISSVAAAAFEVGAPGRHTVTTVQGFPVATSLSLTGTLPNGLTFTDQGDGTAVIAGTPSVGAGGTRTVSVTARNAAGASAPQTLVLTVAEAPTVTSVDSVTIVRGVDASFKITTSAAFPAATAITVAGALPAGLVVTDNGDGTASLSGMTTEAAVDVSLSVSATNGIGAGASQTLTLHVVDATAVQLPIIKPASDGPLSGAPTNAVPGASVHPYGQGFAPGSTVTFGIYSAPRTLGTAIADANGEANAVLTIPTDLSGEHTIMAAGIDRAGKPRSLSWTIMVTATVDPTTPPAPDSSTPSSSAGGSAASTIAETGPGYDVSLVGLLALMLLAAGAVVFRRRRHASN